MAQKLEAQGGAGGDKWDDSEYDGVTKVTVGYSVGIDYVKFDYVKGGQPTQGALHGGQGRRTQTKEIPINHPDEYLISVEGWYDDSNVIQGFRFITNKQPNPETIGYDYSEGDDTKFTLQVEDKKIIGFHGSATNKLNSIGAYFATTTVPAKKLEAKGSETGAEWDDAAHENVKKVYVGQGHDGLAAVKFEYTNGSEVVIGDVHGKPNKRLGFEEFELETGEYITIVKGTTDNTVETGGSVVTRLEFITNTNRTSGPLGMEGTKTFEFNEEGHKITGFHGRFGENYINAIGVYLAPVGTIPLTPAKPAN